MYSAKGDRDIDRGLAGQPPAATKRSRRRVIGGTEDPGTIRLTEARGSLMDSQDRDWRDRAACRDEDTEVFFPTGTTGPALQQIDEAKAICARCPVISNCLNFALQTGQDYGIWGGLTAEERRAQIRRHPRPHRGS